jgi:GNAT superfamily N-acetyltransferase
LSDRKAGALSPVEPLSRLHDLSQFDCQTHPSLNDWLRRFAWTNQQNETSRTYVVHHAQSVVGYYSIATGSIAREAATVRVAKGLANHPVPVLLLARLAVDRTEKGRGLGKALLKDALIRMAHAADIVGARAVLVHAIDADAAEFYRHFDFESSPVNELQLMLLMKDLRALICED